jgi:hypothetical protein
MRTDQATKQKAVALLKELMVLQVTDHRQKDTRVTWSSSVPLMPRPAVRRPVVAKAPPSRLSRILAFLGVRPR